MTVLNQTIRLTTISRLHFGFMDLNGDLGRKFGSLGVALENPAFTISMRPNDCLEISGKEQKRAKSSLLKLAEHFDRPCHFKVNIEKAIPSHSGLGSGTQLALGIARLVTQFWGISKSTRELAAIVDRGARSGVGVAAFDLGGFIMDTGRQTGPDSDKLPSLIALHRNFPEDWCFVMAIPQETKGISGSRENEALAKLKPSRLISEEICRYTLMKLLPGLMEKDIKEFGCALTEIDRRTGMFFQTAQDGIYAEKNAEEIVGYMMQAGAYGAGQSSWGPAIYGLSTYTEAPSVAQSMENFFKRNGIVGEIFIAKPTNHGALMEFGPTLEQ